MQNKELLKKLKKRYFNAGSVGELISFLKEFPPETPCMSISLQVENDKNDGSGDYFVNFDVG